MSEAQHLAEALIVVLSGNNDWFTPLVIAVDGLSAEQAAEIPAPGFNSIWMVVKHMRYYEDFLLCRLRWDADECERTVEGESWEVVEPPFDESAWKADIERLLWVNRQVAEAVALYFDDELEEPYAPGEASRQQVVQGIIAHNSYHTNEIISIRHMLGLWLEKA